MGVGNVIGVGLSIGFIAFFVYLCCLRKRRRNNNGTIVSNEINVNIPRAAQPTHNTSFPPQMPYNPSGNPQFSYPSMPQPGFYPVSQGMNQNFPPQNINIHDPTKNQFQQMPMPMPMPMPNNPTFTQSSAPYPTAPGAFSQNELPPPYSDITKRS